jgi:hypothetical protein
MELDMSDNFLTKCDCGSEMLEFEKFCINGEPVNYQVSMWYRGKRSVMSLKERLRWCWRILTTGEPWCDEVCLSEEEIKQLKRWIGYNIR